MGNFDDRTSEVSSMEVLGATFSDGMMAGLIGGILGSILPIMTLLTGNSDMASLGFFVNILLYFAIGILAGYLYYSRKIGYRWAAAVAAIIGGFLAGLISGVAMGFAFARVPLAPSQPAISTNWVTWSVLSALGAGFIAPLTAWIPGFFIPSDNSYSSGTPAKGAKQETPFERRRKIRFVITMTSVLLIFAIYFCRALSR